MGYAKKSVNSGSAAKTAAPASSAPTSEKKPSTSIWSMQIGTPKQKRVMKRVEVLLFVSELADLLEAGMTLGQALQALANQGEDYSAQKYVCQDLCERIVRGENFSEPTPPKKIT